MKQQAIVGRVGARLGGHEEELSADMDVDRFDRLTRTLSAHQPRRGVLGLLVAGIASRGTSVVAKKKKKGCRPRCGLCADCHKGKCRNKVDGTSCAISGHCTSGTCHCPEGKRYCTNAAACAECCRDDDCGDCYECVDYPEGRCKRKLNYTYCNVGDPCLTVVCDVPTDAFVCTNTCCSSLEEPCGSACCSGAETCCDGICCDNQTEECSGGKCVAKCPAGQARCGSGQTCCASNQACIGGHCTDQCPAGQEFCQGACCEEGEQCCDGACRWVGTCPPGDACHSYNCQRCKPVETIFEPYGTPCGGRCGANGCLICGGNGGCGCLDPCNP